MANGQVLTELRAILADEKSAVDDKTYRRLSLAALAEVYEMVKKAQDHTHPEIQQLTEDVNKMRNRDWLGFGATVLGTSLAAFLGTRK
jgi:hypothetical protein